MDFDSEEKAKTNKGKHTKEHTHLGEGGCMF